MMSLSYSLLSTKIHVPVLRRELVIRQRLLNLLDSGLKSRVTLISAPAGYGKTTLLCEWIANQSPKVHFAWLALDEGDNNPTIFLQYVIAAMQRVDADIGQSILPALQSPNPPDPVGFLPPLLNQINQRKDKLVLILDDYHLITEQPVHQITEQFIEVGGEGLSLVIATRADPPLPVYRYRARGELIEIRQAQLSFTLDETRDFLLLTAGDIIHQKDIEFLYQRTEGWAVGLVLAGLSIQEGHEVSESITSLSGNQVYIMEYLVNEVFERQPERIKALLLKTSILKRLTGPLCDRLTGFDDGYATLEFLKAKNLFVSALDNEKIWYRYHQLFADLLRRRLEHDHRDEIPRLHRAASDWYVQNGFLAEALDHAISSGDFTHTTSLIEKHIDDLWRSGEQSLILRRLQELPIKAILSSVPTCLSLSTMLLFREQHQKANELLLAAEELIRENADLANSYREQVVATRAIHEAQLALLDQDFEKVIYHAQEALKHLPPDWQTLRQVTRMILADASDGQGDAVTAGRLYSELLEKNPLQQNPYLFFLVSIRNTLLNLTCGRLHTVYEYCLHCSKQIGELKPRWPQFEWVLNLVLVAILTEWNHRDELRTLLDDAFERIKGAERSSWDILYLYIVRGYLVFDDIASAKYILNLLEDGIRSFQLPRPYLNDVLAWKIHICLLEGNTLLAEEAVEELKHLDFVKPTCLDEEAYLSIARLWISQEKFQQATELLEALQTNARRGSRNTRLIKIYILRAVVEDMQKKSQKAREYLERAIAQGESEGFVQIFIEEGPVIKHLLKALVSSGNKSAYVLQLVKAFDSPLESRQADRKNIGLIEPFSERECQVLRLLKTHLSQQEMADELCVSVNTIRFHTKNIYRKLGVHNRSEAVEMAKTAGLP